jgi:hypothetical protein
VRGRLVAELMAMSMKWWRMNVVKEWECKLKDDGINETQEKTVSVAKIFLTSRSMCGLWN